jgi:hypothetical protein
MQQVEKPAHIAASEATFAEVPHFKTGILRLASLGPGLHLEVAPIQT